MQAGSNNADLYKSRAWTGRTSADRIRDYSRALQIHDDSINHFNRGVEYLNHSQFTDALQDFNDAIRLSPDNTAAYRSAPAADAYRSYGDVVVPRSHFRASGAVCLQGGNAFVLLRLDIGRVGVVDGVVD